MIYYIISSIKKSHEQTSSAEVSTSGLSLHSDFSWLHKSFDRMIHCKQRDTIISGYIVNIVYADRSLTQNVQHKVQSRACLHWHKRDSS